MVVNSGNKLRDRPYWHMRDLHDGHTARHDRPRRRADGNDRDDLVGNASTPSLPPGTAPVYPSPPHCNARGLSDLGEYLIRRMIAASR